MGLPGCVWAAVRDQPLNQGAGRSGHAGDRIGHLLSRDSPIDHDHPLVPGRPGRLAGNDLAWRVADPRRVTETKIGRPVQAMIAVRIRPPKRSVIEAFRDWAAALPETVGVFVVTGLEDFLLHVAVADNDSLYGFVIDRLTQRPEVADVRTSVVYEHIQNSRIQPATAPRNG
jgi:Lrp/AsnC ligand binding domain